MCSPRNNARGGALFTRDILDRIIVDIERVGPKKHVIVIQLGGNNIRAPCRKNRDQDSDPNQWREDCRAAVFSVLKCYEELFKAVLQQPNCILLVTSIVPSPLTSAKTGDFFALFQVELLKLIKACKPADNQQIQASFDNCLL
jgi:hypothetical protein